VDFLLTNTVRLVYYDGHCSISDRPMTVLKRQIDRLGTVYEHNPPVTVVKILHFLLYVVTISTGLEASQE
jgi:hypothetical protein